MSAGSSVSALPSRARVSGDRNAVDQLARLVGPGKGFDRFHFVANSFLISLWGKTSVSPAGRRR